MPGNGPERLRQTTPIGHFLSFRDTLTLKGQQAQQAANMILGKQV
jgi:hypothetical protein